MKTELEQVYVVLFELAKGWLTVARVEACETHRLNEPHR